MKLHPKRDAIKALGGDKAAKRLYKLLHRVGFKDTNEPSSELFAKFVRDAKGVRES